MNLNNTIQPVQITITLKQFVEAARAAILWRGLDYTHTEVCQYSANGQDGACLFGVAVIDSLGLKYKSGWEGNVASLIDKLGIEASIEAKTWLGSVQRAQDASYSYAIVALLFNQGLEMLQIEGVEQIDPYAIKEQVNSVVEQLTESQLRVNDLQAQLEARERELKEAYTTIGELQG
jgi:hypothetical protein